jgi:small subunit ribosomal protein S1
VHISEMSAHHVDSPEQVVTPGEELWVKIIDLDLARRRISLSIKQAAEGGELAAEYRDHFEVDEAGNYVQGEATAEAEAAWSEYYSDGDPPENTIDIPPIDVPDAPVADAPVADAPADVPVVADAPADVPVVETPADVPMVETPADIPVVETPADVPVVETPAELAEQAPAE